MIKMALARWLSRIVHPAVICVPSLFLATYLGTKSLLAAIKWSAVTAVVFLIPSLAFFRGMVRTGRYSDPDVSVRSQRYSLYLAGGIALILLVAVFILADAPRISQACLFAAVLATTIGAVINRVSKISIHSFVAAGCAAAITYLHPAGLVLVAGAAAVGWARVSLGQHTAGQVLAGWVVAVGSVIAVFGLYL